MTYLSLNYSLLINRYFLVYKTVISITNSDNGRDMDGNARFLIKLKGFEGDKDALKDNYEKEVLPEIIQTTPVPSTTTTDAPKPTSVMPDGNIL